MTYHSVEANQVLPREDCAFASPQLCYVPANFCAIPGNCSAGYVTCKYTNGRKFLCKLFIKSNFFKENNINVDESVEIIDESVTEEKLLSREIEFDDKYLDKIETVAGDLEEFSTVKLELYLNPLKLNLDLIRKMEDLKKIIKNLISFLVFTRNSLINFEYLDENYGASYIFIKNTNLNSSFGRIGVQTKIEIAKIHFRNETFGYNSQELGGLESQMVHLLKFVDIQLNSKKNYCPHALIVGSSGSGKYSLVKNLATRMKCALFEIKGLDFIKNYPGETEAELRKIFKNIKKFNKICGGGTKSILLVKDVESICPNLKNSKETDISNISRISSQFSSLLDENMQSGDIIVIGTSSNLESLDNKMRRPGRFEKEIQIRTPSEKQRQEILNVLSKKYFTEEEISSITEYLVKRTPGYVGADLKLIINFVRIQKLQKNSDEIVSFLAEALKNVRPSSLKGNIGIISDLSTTMETIGGMKSLKKVLRVSVLGPLQHPQSFKRFGMKPLKGILLYGPPGCAKTTIAKCLAAEAKMTFLAVSAAEIYSPYVGDAEKLISKLFNQARMSAPAVIFLDEIDSLVGSRSMQGMKGNEVHTRVLSTLLTEMDGVGITEQSAISTSDDSKNILVIAATNRPDIIDDALLRPGRLTKLIHVPAPDLESRYKIFKMMGEKMPFDNMVDLKELANVTERYSGADVIDLCNQAALYAASLDLNADKIYKDHFDEILKENRPSLTIDQIEWYKHFEARHKGV